MCLYVVTEVCVCLYGYICMCVNEGVYVHTCIDLYVCMTTCIRICVHTHGMMTLSMPSLVPRLGDVSSGRQCTWNSSASWQQRDQLLLMPSLQGLQARHRGWTPQVPCPFCVSWRRPVFFLHSSLWSCLQDEVHQRCLHASSSELSNSDIKTGTSFYAGGSLESPLPALFPRGTTASTSQTPCPLSDSEVISE